MAGLTVAAATGAPGPIYSLGALKAVIVDLTFDSSYPTGGEVLDPALVGLTTIVAVQCGWALHSTPTTAVGIVWNPATGKLIALYSTANAGNVAMAEATSTNDLSASTVRAIIYGT